MRGSNLLLVSTTLSLLPIMFSELPIFADYYRQLRDVDAAFAKQCISTWRLYLEGPPNRPNEDIYGLIEVKFEGIRRRSTFKFSREKSYKRF